MANLLDRALSAPSRATPPDVARRLNLQRCPARLTAHAAKATFHLDLAALHSSATVHVCQHRAEPHAGIVYIAHFLGADEVEELHAQWPEPHIMYGPHCQKQIGELASFVRSPHATPAHPLARLESRINQFTGLDVGLFRGKQYHGRGYRGPRTAPSYAFGNCTSTTTHLRDGLHHDANGACCGLPKLSLARVATLLLYDQADGVAGAHTVFPTLLRDANAPGRRLAVSDSMWRTLVGDGHVQYKPKDAEHLPDRTGRYQNRTMGGVTGAACAELAAADAENRTSDIFGVRPVAGDAILFFMKPPGAFYPSYHQYHSACPLLLGVKGTIQKFLQRGEPGGNPADIGMWPPSRGTASRP